MQLTFVDCSIFKHELINELKTLLLGSHLEVRQLLVLVEVELLRVVVGLLLAISSKSAVSVVSIFLFSKFFLNINES